MPPDIAKIYDLYGARVFRRARNLLRDPERARDATQEFQAIADELMLEEAGTT